MHLRSLSFGFLLGLCAALTPACGPKPCNTSTCAAGCCDAKGECQQGSSNTSCGQLGSACQSCQFGTACNLGACMATSSNGGGTTNGGGAATGGGGGTSNGGGAATGGGSTGGGGTGCDGCLFNGTCIARANSNNDTLCGQGGVTCATCSGNLHCNNFVCTAGGTGGGSATGGGGATGGGATGGGATGGGSGGVTVGSPCTNSGQCSALGAGATCKLQTMPYSGQTPTPYPSGFCSLPCSGVGTCPGGSTCAGGTSSLPYLFNEVDRFCTKACTAQNQGQCSSGFECYYVDDLTQMPPHAGCWISSTSTRLYTGGGLPSKAGQACTMDSQCSSPPDPILGQCITGLPNGYCFISTTFDTSGAWCQAGGKSMIDYPLSDGGVSHYCVGTCSTVGQLAPGGRAGYTCFNNSNATGNIVWRACSTNADCFSSVPYCNATNGFCCADMALTQCATTL